MKGDKNSIMIERQFVSVPGCSGRMILLDRHARLLASDGEIDIKLGLIKGGNPDCASYPEGTRSLSKAEIQIVKKRFDLP
jgi:hypothetical protein